MVEARARLDGGLAELKDQLEEGGHALQQMWGEVADASGAVRGELLEPDDDDGEFAPNPPPPATHLGAPPPQPGAVPPPPATAPAPAAAPPIVARR